MASLFEPLRRGRPERTGDSASPGLGLSIVGAIAAAHSASLWPAPCPGGGNLVVQVVFPRPPGQMPPVRISPAMPALRAG